MSSSRNILIITPGFAASEDDDFTIPALQEYVLGILKYRPDWKMTIMSLQYPYLKGSYDYHGVRVYTFNGGNNKWKKPWLFRKVKKAFQILNRNEAFDLIHSFWLTDSALIAQKLSEKYNVPHISTAMGQDVLEQNAYRKLLNTKNFPIVYLSHFQKEQSCFTQKPNDMLIPWGLEPMPASDYQKRDIDVVGVGNLTSVKNFDLFIDVIAKLKIRVGSLKALVIGYGDEEKRLKERVKQLNLTNTIEFRGKLERRDVMALLKRTKCLLHTSSYESFGMVLIEALDAGCKIVSTPVGIAAEVGETSIESEGLASLVESSLSVSGSDTMNVQFGFPIEKTIEAYDNAYESLVKK